jgi:tetratricopeptide (TPR) repeat protein
MEASEFGKNSGSSRNEPGFVLSRLPWAMGAGMLVVYAASLHSWVSPDGLQLFASINGSTWRPELLRPVTWLVTYPFRWLPAAWIPLGLNLLTAVCAALALALLARSTALLPHDRTEAERKRMTGGTSFLTIRTAWLPPVLAVLVCGLQLTFWEHAIVATGEMLDLLLFACLVGCLVEYRASREDSWLLRFALAYGLALANNWAMAAYGPLFLVAVVWMKGVRFLDVPFLDHVLERFKTSTLPLWTRIFQALDSLVNLRFLARAIGCVLAGLALFLLLPLIASFSRQGHTDFWAAMRFLLRTYKSELTLLPMSLVLILSLTSLAPVVFMGICWGRFSGDHFSLARSCGIALLHLAHGCFLAVCLWTLLDAPFSPRRLGLDFPCLPLYFLGALSIGYFSGYFLLVFGTKAPNAALRSPPLMRCLCPCVSGAIWLLLLAGPALLVYKNLPAIAQKRARPLVEYAASIERSLPPAGAVILNDDQPSRLVYLESILIRSGKRSGYLLLDAGLLSEDPAYSQFAQRRNPGFKPALPRANQSSDITNPVVLVNLMLDLAQTHGLYSLTPIHGYLAEAFHAQPHGLLYRLKPFPADRPDAEPMPPAEVAENQRFWQALEEDQLPRLIHRLASPERPQGGPNPLLRLWRAAQERPEKDRWALLAGSCYAQALDCWGVELQKAGRLKEAGRCFEEARQLNPDNAAARINERFNRDMQAHKAPVLLSREELDKWLDKHRSWLETVWADGPIDEPNCCVQLGTSFYEARLVRLAIQQLERARALAPSFTNAAFQLARLFFLADDYSRALEQANHVLQLAPHHQPALLLKGASLAQLKSYDQAISPLTEVLALQSTNGVARTARAYAYLQLGNLEAALQDYQTVVRADPKAYQAYFGLAEIAHRKKDTAAAIRNCELYLASAPANSADTKLIRSCLEELRQKGAKPKSQ